MPSFWRNNSRKNDRAGPSSAESQTQIKRKKKILHFSSCFPGSVCKDKGSSFIFATPAGNIKWNMMTKYCFSSFPSPCLVCPSVCLSARLSCLSALIMIYCEITDFMTRSKTLPPCNPTEPFTISDPQNPEIDKFYVARKRPIDGFWG